MGYCYAFGYNRDPKTMTFVLGIPDWVFYGIVLPWACCTLLSFWVANYLIADDDLGEAREETALKSSADSREAGHV